MTCLKSLPYIRLAFQKLVFEESGEKCVAKEREIFQLLDEFVEKWNQLHPGKELAWDIPSEEDEAEPGR